LKAAAPSPQVVPPDDPPFLPLPGGTGRYRVTFPIETGPRNLVQRILAFDPGERSAFANERSEDVLYVVAGGGRAVIGDRDVPIDPGSAFLAPPGLPYEIEGRGADPLVLVSVVAPPRWADVAPSSIAAPVDLDRATVHERDQPELPAGIDRYFKMLIDPSRGCRFMTQFVGFIRRGSAPFHIHHYEECIHVLEGEGLVHIEDRSEPIASGAGVYLPPGTSHRIETVSDGLLKLLGVFSPAGSPAERMDAGMPGP
jgi:mannose-6-phosphate isomerase-like protein (cupin superfamily)